MKFGFVAFLASWLIHFPITAQFSDTFSDGDLNGWQGDISHFVVNANQQLQLNAPGGSTSSWLHTPVTYLDSMVWEFYLKLDFSPSTSNQLRIFLGLNSSDLALSSGYLLEIGATGDQDALELKSYENGNVTSIASSIPALVGSEPVELQIRISRDSKGLWNCYKVGQVSELLFSVMEMTYPLSQMTTFGFYCKYTDTRRDKFFFDDIIIQPIVPDTTAPTWLDLTLEDNNTVQLLFDEPMDPVSSNVTANYVLTPGNLNPETIIQNDNQIELTWNPSFVSQQVYTLMIQNIKDLAGNSIVTDSKEFTYIEIGQALTNELLITEIMADPSPTIGLPDAEYIEVLNHSSKVFELSDYQLVTGASAKVLPAGLIFPGEYVIICDADNSGLYSGFGRVISLDNMSSLTNSGTYLGLQDLLDNPIHEVRYDDSWYVDPTKSDGGWALEMQNPFHICSEKENWAAANNLLGGTPGSINSQWSVTPDTEGPDFISLFTSSPQTIQLRFNEKLDEVLMENPSVYAFIPALGVSNITFPDPSTVEITFSQDLTEDVVYQLLPFDAYDCLGNLAVVTDTITFGLIADPAAGDILINEILFNPATGGSRFIEIVNVSQKFIDLNDLAVGRLSTVHNDIFPAGIAEIIGPGELAVFSPDVPDILSRYTAPHPSRLFPASLPSWDDQSDNVAILSGGVVLDSFTYSSAWHHPVIADQNGVSLERVSVSSPSTFASTWHSASAVSGYATPTGENSQKTTPGGQVETPFSITNKQFSPNEDGFKDFLALNFQLETGDYIGSVWVYDLEGREINRLLSNESLGTSTLIQWDGRTSEGLLADMGIYILFVQLWDVAGDVSEYQETCALVKR
jgi:hypothetical protein